MSDKAKTALCLLVLLAIYSVVGRWDDEDRAGAAAIRLTCTPEIAEEEPGTDPLPAGRRGNDPPEPYGSTAVLGSERAPSVFRCVVVG
jgi:hypothetical protein